MTELPVLSARPESFSRFMQYEKVMRSAQGMAIHGDRAFILYDTGVCAVYDLTARDPHPLASFRLGSWNEGTPAREYLNHANNCMFSSVHRNGNPIPLLYVTIGTGIGADEDGFYYRAAVEDIREETGADGRPVFRAETVQTISYKPDGIERTPWAAPCWGCPAFFLDPETQRLYIFSAKYRTKRGCVPDGCRNAFITTAFPLPDPAQGGFIRLTPDDIIDQFVLPTDVEFTQGGQLLRGKIIYTFGCPSHDYPDVIQVFDLKEKRLCAGASGLDEALRMEELECCDEWNGLLLCNTNGTPEAGTLYAVPLNELGLA